MEVRREVRCPSCNHSNRPDRRYCTECGTPLCRPCRGCNSPVEPGEKFCGRCGAPLTGTVVPPREGSPAVYTPQHLAEKILSSRAALEGERKQVTVLLPDVKGSMELAEQVDPEEWHKILERMDYTAQGHTVGLAARIEQLAEPGTVFLSAHTAALVSGYFTLRDLGPAHIKGVRDAIGVFALDEVERAHIQRVLAEAATLEEAAARLGINVTTLSRKRKRYDIN